MARLKAEGLPVLSLDRDGATEALHLSWSGGDGVRKSWRPSMFVKEIALASASDEAERSRITKLYTFDGLNRVEVEEGETQRALEALLAADGVDGAYVKPLDQPP